MDEVLRIVKRRLAVEDNEQDDLITDFIRNVESRILNYCGIEFVPVQLKFVWADMVVDALKKSNAGGSAEGILSAADVSSVQLGDSSVSFRNGDSFLSDYAGQLNAFRKVKTV